MRNIKIEFLDIPPTKNRSVEVVERKGIGHPDTICDSIMNEISIELSKEYIKRFGKVMHHNIDKSLLAAGESRKKFGGGEVIEPMRLIIGDRATFQVGNEVVPVNEIAIGTAQKWFKENIRFIEPCKHVQYESVLRKGSEELTDIFSRKGEVFVSNDTSAAVGYAPMSELEKLVYETERYLNSKEFKKEFPESGEDIKIMGLREDDRVHFTIAMAFVDRFIKSEEDYFRKKDEIVDHAIKFVSCKTDKKVAVDMNTLDVRGRGMGGIYLSVTGTSAEDGDCGQVGRGNRVNGVIPLSRPVSNEAAAGKNPVSHVGKIYNLLTHKIAEQIHKDVPGLEEVYVWLLSQIGKPIDQPKIIAVQVIQNKKGVDAEFLKKDIERIVDEKLDKENINKFTHDLIYKKMPVC